MIVREAGLIIFNCDKCSDFVETEERGFEEAKLKLDAEKWHAVRVGLNWEHICPSCWSKL